MKLRWKNIIRKNMTEKGVFGSTEKRSTRPENKKNENLMCRPEIEKDQRRIPAIKIGNVPPLGVSERGTSTMPH